MTFSPRRVDDQVSVAPQIAPDDLAAIKAAGFVTVVNNRPDGEEYGQPTATDIAAAAAAAGLRYVEIPMGAAPLTVDTVTAMAAAIAHGPTLAFCRSGTRSCHLWAMASAQRGVDPATLTEQAAAAGYDLSGLRPMLDQLAPQMSRAR